MAGDDARSGESLVTAVSLRVREIVRDCVQQWADGESFDERALVEANPDVAPELSRELSKLRLVVDATRKTVPPPAVGNGGALPATLPLPPHGIPVRCPHCRHPFELLTDAELSGITCESCGTTFNLVDESLATDEAPPLMRVGHFELISRLGRGGYGTVWKARDLELDRTVAVKVPRTDRCDSTEQEKFLREARAAAQLRHPNIVAIHEVGRQGKTPFIVCDLVRGMTLAQWLGFNRPGPRESAALCLKIAAALQHAHEAGVVHRDLKPPNIMMDADGQPHVMDFGIAKWEAGGMTVAVDGEPIGTAAYMSPEQADGKGHNADARSDLYSLGVILFELITGELPFRGSRHAILHQAIHDDPPSPRKLNTAVPRDLETICLKCLEKRPDARIGSAAELREELQRYIDGKPIKCRPIGRLQRTVRAARRRPAVAAAICLAAIISIVGPTMAWQQFDLRREVQEYAQQESKLRRDIQEQLKQSTELRHAEKLGEAELLVSSRQESYTKRALDALMEAQQLNVADQKSDRQRHLAAAALGDFLGYKPIEIERISGFEEGIICLAFNEDAARLAVGLADGRIAVFDATSGDEIASFLAHSQAAGRVHVRAIRFLAAPAGSDEPPMLSVASDGTIATSSWTGDTYRSMTMPRQLDISAIWSARFSRGGSRIVAQNKLEAALWDTTSWERLQTFNPSASLKAKAAQLKAVAISPDDVHVVAGYLLQQADCAFSVWDGLSGKLLDEVSGRGGTYEDSIAFTPDGNLLALGSERLIKYEMPPPLSQYDLHGGDEIACVAFHPFASYEAVYHWNNKFAIRNRVVNQELASFDIRNGNGRDVILFSDNGRRLALSTGESIRIWDLEVPERRTWLGHEDASGIASIAFSPNGELLVSAGKDQMVRIWDARTARQIHPPLRFAGKVQSVAFSPDGVFLAVGMWGGADENLTVYRTIDWTPVATLEHTLGDKIYGLAFGKGRDEGSFLLAASGVGVSLWDVDVEHDAHGKSRLDIVHNHDFRAISHDAGTERETRFLQFSPSGRYVAWIEAFEKGLVRVADCRTGALRAQDLAWLVGDGYHGLAFGSDDASLVFIGTDSRPELWDVTSKPPRQKLRIRDVGDKLTSTHLAVSPDGRFLAARADTRSVGIWDLKAEKRLFVLRPEPSDIWSLAWSGDRRLAVGTAAGEVSVWDMNAVAAQLERVNLAPAGLAIRED